MINKFAMATAAIALAAPAFAGAGGKMDPIVEPEVVEPVEMEEPAAPARDWTGPYVGLNGTYIGVNNRDRGNFGGSGPGIGAHAGYNFDFGGFVLGAEAEWDFYNDVTLDELGDRFPTAGEVENMGRLKARAGVPIGNDLLAYGLAGVAHMRTSDIGNNTGWVVGAGAEYMVTNDFSVGAEVAYHRFDDVSVDGGGDVPAGGADYDFEATTVSVRGSFRF